MLWFYTAAASAIIWGILSIVSKRLMEDSSSLVFTTLYSLLATLFYLPVFIYMMTRTPLNLNTSVLAAIIVSGVSNIVAFLVYNSSIKTGEVSKVVPFTRLSPIFTAILGFLILQEQIGIKLGAGITAATLGSYIVLREKENNILNIIERKENLKPITLAVLSAVFYSTAAIADRTATQQIAPELYTFLIYSFMTTGFIGYSLTKKPENIAKMKKRLTENTGLYTFTGLLAAAGSLLIYTAFSLAPASKVMPIINLQVLVSVIAGGLIFHEDNITKKTIGSIILITGVTLVAI